jgi:hypothetical protein
MTRLLLILVISLTLTVITSFQVKTFTIDDLLENPKQYNGQIITVSGYYIDEFENRSLWATKKYAKKFDLKHSIWLGTFSKDIEFIDCNGNISDNASLHKKNITVTGTFKYSPDTISGKVYGYGHMNIWPAEIIEITFMKIN